MAASRWLSIAFGDKVSDRFASIRATALSPQTIALGSIALPCFAATVIWFTDAQLLWGIDTSTPLNIQDVGSYFEIPSRSLGPPDARKLPFIMPLGILLWLWAKLGLPYDLSVVQPIAVFTLLLSAGVGMYALIGYLIPRIGSLGRIAAGLFYTFNLYSLLTIWTALSNLVFHYCLLPCVLLACAVALAKHRPVWGVAAGVVWSLTVTPAYITTPVAATDLLLITSFIAYRVIRERSERRAMLLTGLSLLGTWLVMNLFWVIPVAIYYSSEAARGLAVGDPTELFHLNSPNLFEALRLFGYWGMETKFLGNDYFSWSSFYGGPVRWIAFALPLLAAVGIMWGRQRPHVHNCPACASEEVSRPRLRRARCSQCGLEFRVRAKPDSSRSHVLFFAFMWLSALLLITGDNEPFGVTKRWLFSELQITAPFRSVYQRFGVYLAFAYAPLLAAGIDHVTRLFRSHPRKNAALAGLGIATFLISLIVVVNAWPIWNGSAFTQSGIFPSGKIEIPESYRSVASWINKHPGDFNVIAFPFGPTAVTSLRWSGGADGYLGIEPLELLSSKPLVLGDPAAPHVSRLASQVASTAQNRGMALNLLNARFVVVHLDANLDLLQHQPGWSGLNSGGLLSSLREDSILHEVTSTDELVVFEFEQWEPHRVFALRSLDETSSIGNGADVDSLTYIASGGHYKVEPPGFATVVVNSSFDPWWRLFGERPGNVSPGLTGFEIRGGQRELLIEHRIQQLLPWLLTLALIPPAGLLAGWTRTAVRRKRSEAADTGELV